MSSRACSLPEPASKPARRNGSLRPRRPPPAAAPLPPGSPLIGRPAGQCQARRQARAHAGAAAIATAADKLPLAQLKLPRGFQIEVYAAGVADARSLRVGDKGTVFVGTRPATRSMPW